MSFRFENMVTMEGLYRAWMDFSTDKRTKKDVMAFGANIEDELLMLYEDLIHDGYRHGPYERFVVNDPKKRVIHKATVRDRVVHRLVYNMLLPVFHLRWLDCSYSCRPGFGQHRSIADVQKGIQQATRDQSQVCWILKCDVRKFFDSIDQPILLRLLFLRIRDERARALLTEIVRSFSVIPNKGLPIGNLTSQFFANVYMHELDWHIKHVVKVRRYYRYADDVLFVCDSFEQANVYHKEIERFLRMRLCLFLHPNKVIIRKHTWGIDWLGKVILPDYLLLRPKTQKRMMHKIRELVKKGDTKKLRSSVGSYHGLLIGTARRSVDRVLLQQVAECRGM